MRLPDELEAQIDALWLQKADDARKEGYATEQEAADFHAALERMTVNDNDNING